MEDLYRGTDKPSPNNFSPDLLSSSEVMLGKRQPQEEEGLRRETEMMYSLPEFGRGQAEIDPLDVPAHSLTQLDEYGMADGWSPVQEAFKE